MTEISGNTLYDVVIIGNGALGLSLAYQLKKRDAGLRVALIGPNARPGSATLAAGAMVNVWAELAYDQFAYPALAERAELTISAMNLWDGLCEELGQYVEDGPEISWGTYVINNAIGAAHEVRTLDYILRICAERGVEHKVLSGDDISWLNPEAKGRITRAVWLPDGRFEPKKVIAAYEAALRALEVDVIDQEAVSLDVMSGDKTVRTRDGKVYRGKQVVLANGAYAQALIDQVPELKQETPRLVWGAGSAMRIYLPDWVKNGGGIDNTVLDIDHVVRTVDRGGACGVHLVPYGNGEYYCGASSGVWYDPEPYARVHAIHVLLRSLVEEIHHAFFFSAMDLVGPGFRPTAIDTFPLLGESHIEGVWFANGAKRDGLTCSPFISRELASAMLGGPSALPERFRPSRPLISYKTKSKALDDAASSDFGGEVQHGLYLPPYAVKSYFEHKRKKVEAVYEKRGIEDFGIHPEVVHLYDGDDFFAGINHPRESVSE